ncbi:MAG: phytoene/squalene synthase family protein [Proteobacteria bacterium]|nr:phytoene/squalene synthase family protein [Pseudomonadota bacterium]
MISPPTDKDELFQDQILQGVSRTFALTIPSLPAALSRAVANAYLLCRIADTIEDDAELVLDDKRRFSQRFIDAIRGAEDGASFGEELAPRLADHTLAAERELVANTAAAIRITHSLNSTQRAAIEKCVRTMADGMVYYQGQETLNGLADQAAMDRYCYYVAGVVGELLTELFCDYCPQLQTRKPEMMRLAVSFGQGLQMTNILKDIWDDRRRGACWLPADVFALRGVQLATFEPGDGGTDFEDGLGHLIAIAHGHLRNALRYTVMLPRSEVGIRKFCLWALGMAVLTLRKLDKKRNFSNSQDVKISRRSVTATVMSTKLAVRSNLALSALFALASAGLPQREVNAPVPDHIDQSESRVV